MTQNNTLVSGILGYQFKLKKMVPKSDKQAPKTSEGVPVSLPATIPETQNNTEDRGSIYNMGELNKKLTHQYQIQGQNWGAGKT